MNDKEEELKKVIMDLEEERRDLEDANIELCKRLCESNDEIREAHEELISVIFFSPSRMLSADSNNKLCYLCLCICRD